MITLDITIDGTPRTKGSWIPIRRKNGGTFMKPQTDEKPWAMSVAWSAKAARPRLIAKPASVEVCLDFEIRAPKRASNTFPPGDADKLARSCLDALTGICWDDDVQVVRLVATKRYGANPGVRIVVSEVAP